ncbi:MAG TPA: formyltransferase family protein [Gaiellaceae bacterium]|nr:formyltransferase family protein [Gaiellaceae bacterium]
MVPTYLGDHVDAVRAAGHEPTIVITARTPSLQADAFLSEETVGVDVVVAAGRRSLAPILRGYEIDLGLCAGFPWRIPTEAIDAPKLGIVNAHIGMLPRYRGPFPVAWAVRNGETEIGMTYHFMDADFDTGNVLAQAAVPLGEEDDWPSTLAKLHVAGNELLPRVFERLAKGDRGEPQGDGEYQSGFEDDYSRLDTEATAADVHRQVRAWGFVPPRARVGPILERNGGRRRIVRTSLVEVDGAERLDCADASVWILESEPA